MCLFPSVYRGEFEEICKIKNTLLRSSCESNCSFFNFDSTLHYTGKVAAHCYYCHPYSSWERGSNENLNRMIRRQFPKGTNFAKVTSYTVRQVESWMNSFPRKILGYKTADMAFKECLSAMQQN